MTLIMPHNSTRMRPTLNMVVYFKMHMNWLRATQVSIAVTLGVVAALAVPRITSYLWRTGDNESQSGIVLVSAEGDNIQKSNWLVVLKSDGTGWYLPGLGDPARLNDRLVGYHSAINMVMKSAGTHGRIVVDGGRRTIRIIKNDCTSYVDLLYSDGADAAIYKEWEGLKSDLGVPPDAY